MTFLTAVGIVEGKNFEAILNSEAAVGEIDGTCEGEVVGDPVGDFVGKVVGPTVSSVGALVGRNDGVSLG